MFRTLLIRGLAVGLLLAVATTAGAQVTPEGTVITNTATVSFKDANNNSYSANGSVSVTVGFQPGVDITGPATLSPSTPQAGISATFTINNTGNGTNQFSVAFTPPAGITVTGYTINGAGSYADVAALNAALALVNVARGGSVTVGVVYNTIAANAGNTYSFVMDANSVRAQPAGASGNITDQATIAVTPGHITGVSVTPDAGAASKIPGTQTAVFTVTNNGTAASTFNLSAGAAGAGFSIVSVNGTAGTSAATGSIAPGGNAAINVVYTITTAATTGTISLTATHPTDAAATDGGSWDITVSKPALTLTKAAYLDDGAGAPGAAVAGAVPPGVTVWYVITITNGGGAATAESVVVTDPIPAQLTFVSAAGVTGTWTSVSEAGGTVTATLSGTLAAGASASFRIKTTVK